MGTSALRQHHHVRTAIASVTRSADGSTAYVEGIAYPSLDPPASGAIPHAEAALRIDSYVTWMRRSTLERFAHQFLRHGRAIDSGHDHREVGELVESYLTGPGHPTYPADVWVTRVMTRDPATIEALDAGELTGFSIEFVSPIAIVPLKIEGESGTVQTVRTGEITDPLPLYLSLVERPSIGVPFEVVEMRGERSAERREFSQVRAEQPAAPELGRVTRVVSVASPDSAETPENRGAHGEPTTMDKPDTEARAAQPEGAQTTTTAQEPPVQTAEPAGTVTPAAVAATAASEQPATQLRSVRDALTPERRTAIDAIARRSDAPYDLAACWVECKDSLTMWDGFCNALYLYENVYWNIRYCSEPEGVQAAMIEKAAQDFARIVSGIARAFPGYVASAAADEAAEAAAAIAADIATDTEELAAVQGRSVQGVQSARAGKVLSAANREKVQSARDACEKSMGHLDELLAIGAAVEEAEGAGEGEARSAQPTAPAAPTAPTTPVTAATPTAQPAQPDPVAALEQRLAAVEARTSLDAAALAQARADLDAANARSAEITKAHDEATAARDTARARVAELEGMRPAARSGSGDAPAPAQPASAQTTQKRSPFETVPFPGASTRKS